MTAEQMEALADEIAKVMPLASLRGIVEQHPDVVHFDTLIKEYSGPMQGQRRAVTVMLLEKYRTRGVLAALLEGLYAFSHKLEGSERLRSLLEPGLTAGDHKEALLARRDNFFLSQNLQTRLAEFIPKVCCIVGEFNLDGTTYRPQGTGFLVGPDLVLTAMHVFGKLAEVDKNRVPQSFRVFFDHLQGGPVSGVQATPAGARCVHLADNWWVEGRLPFKQDGEIDEPDEQQQLAMKEQLDFVLVRLKDKVGIQPISPWGGRARSWISLPDIAVPGQLKRDERLIITQHPSGQPQCLDFGRYERLCPSQTRIFYSVSTAPGSSGAPCFNQEFQLVGMHNARFQPADVPRPIANQAIRFDSIQSYIEPHIEETRLPEPAQVWSLSADHSVCRPVIGRKTLLGWIESGMADADAGSRIFVMVPEEGQGGKSFSWEVLGHRLKDQPKHLRVLFNKDCNRETMVLEDFIATLAGIFNFSLDGDLPMPARTADDNDKVRRWASQLVPQWFCAQLDTGRTTIEDRREAARAMVASSLILGARVDPEFQKLANSPDPVEVPVQRWTHAWIVFDDLHSLPLGQEIQDFLAGLALMANSGNETYQVLRRLRLMFLGKCPEFLDPALACVERINARTYLDGIDDLGRDIMSAAPYAKGEVIHDVIDTIKDMMATLEELDNNPALPLSILQKVASTTLTKKLPNWMNS